MTTTEIITALLDEDDLARIDALARAHSLTREEMLAEIVRSGLLAHEQEEAGPVSRVRVKGTR